MHKVRVIPLSFPGKALAAEGRLGGVVQRVIRHARAPRSLPGLVWKNARYAIQSRRPAYWNQLAGRFARGGQHAEALACHDRALVIRPDDPQTWLDRGRALRDLDRLEEAEASLREALRRRPDFGDAHNELGTVLDYLGRFEEAEASVRQALRLRPEHAAAHANLGYILYHLGRAGEAQASYRSALRLCEVPEWHVDLGRSLLMDGNFNEGWREFEWRWRTARMTAQGPLFPVPSWNGEPIGDRAILLVSDQGIGDALQFCRYVPRVAAGARATILAVQPSLVRLLSRLPGVSHVITQGIEPPAYDLWCAFMSLPYAVGATLDSIPPAPYLTADPADEAHWRERLAGLPGLRVGLCWAGGGSSNLGKIAWDRRRSVGLDALAPLGGLPGVRYVSLQIGPKAAETVDPPPGMMLHDFSADLHDFADTAALVANLDLVISVDTAVAHLAGALGKPVWLLNRFDTCFRWLLDRDDSPWYPTLRQFRQPAPGDWQAVIGRVRDALRRVAAGDRSQLRPIATHAGSS
jgi:hypothetical protein